VALIQSLLGNGPTYEMIKAVSGDEWLELYKFVEKGAIPSVDRNLWGAAVATKWLHGSEYGLLLGGHHLERLIFENIEGYGWKAFRTCFDEDWAGEDYSPETGMYSARNIIGNTEPRWRWADGPGVMRVSRLWRPLRKCPYEHTPPSYLHKGARTFSESLALVKAAWDPRQTLDLPDWYQALEGHLRARWPRIPSPVELRVGHLLAAQSCLHADQGGLRQINFSDDSDTDEDNT
jgi:hypothetical protein